MLFAIAHHSKIGVLGEIIIICYVISILLLVQDSLIFSTSAFLEKWELLESLIFFVGH